MQPSRLGTVVTLLASALLAAACNSATGSSAPATGVGPSTGASVAPSAATSQAPAASVNIGDAGVGLSNLTSYKFSLQSGSVTVEAIVVNSPTKARQVFETLGSTAIRIVQIGTDVWIDQGTGTYLKNVIPASQVDQMFGGFDPGTIMSGLQRQSEINKLPVVGVEPKNGVSCTHLHADSTTPLPAGASPIPAGGAFDLWIATGGGFLVALEVTGMAAAGIGDIKLEVTNINDSSLSVSAPA